MFLKCAYNCGKVDKTGRGEEATMVKEIGKKGKKMIRQHHLSVIFFWIIIFLMAVRFSGSFNRVEAYDRSGQQILDIFSDKLETGIEIAKSITKAAAEQSKRGEGSAVFGRSRGVFAGVINGIISGSAINMIAKLVRELVISARMVAVLMATAIFFPLEDIRSLKAKAAAKNFDYQRRYSLTSLIVIFFVSSVAGWVWEVGMHMIETGDFVNRGVLHGPWLPIYGTGSVLILVTLNLFRKKPVAEFFSVVILCGCVEYFTSYCLEMMHGGRRWWDYRGYFLNLQGRICAEGLLLFGVGGMVVVYLIAPLLDDCLRRVNHKIVVLLCGVILCSLMIDGTYSMRHPNAGRGITGEAQTAMEYRTDGGFL